MLLSTNYRCKENIVKFSEVGISNNSIREPKQMKAFEQGGKISVLNCGSDSLYANSKAVADFMIDLKKNGERLSDVCVLSRYNQDLSILNGMLFLNGVYTDIPKEALMINGKMFNDIKGVVDLASGDDWFLNISTIMLNGWKVIRYLNKATAKMLGNCLKNNNIKFSELVAIISNSDSSTNLMSKLDNVSQAGLYDLANRMSYDTLNDIKRLDLILNNKGTPNDKKASLLVDHYENNASWRFKGDRSRKLLTANCKFVIELLKEKGYDETKSLLNGINQYEKGNIASLGAKAILSTCHRSKGREWKYVILMCDDNDSFPSREKIRTSIDKGISEREVIEWIQEERRLHYVAKTRAKEKLVLVSDINNMSMFTRECLGFRETDYDIMSIAMEPIKDNKSHLGREWKLNEKETELY